MTHLIVKQVVDGTHGGLGLIVVELDVVVRLDHLSTGSLQIGNLFHPLVTTLCCCLLCHNGEHDTTDIQWGIHVLAQHP